MSTVKKCVCWTRCCTCTIGGSTHFHICVSPQFLAICATSCATLLFYLLVCWNFHYLKQFKPFHFTPPSNFEFQELSCKLIQKLLFIFWISNYYFSILTNHFLKLSILYSISFKYQNFKYILIVSLFTFFLHLRKQKEIIKICFT